MKRINRLLKNDDFKKVLDNHKCVSRENFKVFSKKNALDHSRIGISVSSKIGNSVVRHKVKRQISDIVDHCFDKKESIDIVIIAKMNFLNVNYKDNYSALKECLEKILRKDKRDEK